MSLIKEAIANGELFWAHAFELACAKHDIDHRTTKVKHPWANGQVERMNRTIKDATDAFTMRAMISPTSFGRRLKTLKGLTPYEFVGKACASSPERFSINPLQQMPGLNILAARAWRMSNRSGSDREGVTRRIDWPGRIVRSERTL